MAINLSALRSRRAVLATLAGALGTVAADLRLPRPAQAGTDGDVVLGADNSTTTLTSVINTDLSGSAFLAHSGPNLPGPPAGTGVYATTEKETGIGLLGQGVESATSNSVGIEGTGDWGVIGFGLVGVLGTGEAQQVGVFATASQPVGLVPPTNCGVVAQADSGGTGIIGYTGQPIPTPTRDVGIYGRSDTGQSSGRGVVGICDPGIGVLGQSNSFGVGVRAYNTNNSGLALRVSGKAAFDRSGKLTVTAGHSSVVKSSIGLSSASFILATLQTNVTGLAIQSVVTDPAGSKFTIYLNKAPSVNVAVAWMAVN